jgi:hypothetical protein
MDSHRNSGVVIMRKGRQRDLIHICAKYVGKSLRNAFKSSLLYVVQQSLKPTARVVAKQAEPRDTDKSVASASYNEPSSQTSG